MEIQYSYLILQTIYFREADTPVPRYNTEAGSHVRDHVS